MGRIYIACTPEEAHFATGLQKTLGKAGVYTVVLNHREAVTAALRAQKPGMVILLLSPTAVESPFLRQIVGLFRKRGARIIPVLVAPLTNRDQPLPFRYIDAAHNPHRQLKALARRLSPPTSKSRPVTPTRSSLRLRGVLAGGLLGVMLVIAAVLLLVSPHQTPVPTQETAFVDETAEVSPTREKRVARDTSPTPEQTSTLEAEATPELTETPDAAGDEDETDSGMMASFYADPLDGYAPLVVTFTNTSEGDIAAYQWDFDGDGITDSTARDPAPYTYVQPGGYRALLTVTAENGATSSAVEFFEVYPSETAALPTVPVIINSTDPTESLISASFVAQPDSGAAPLTVRFTNQSSGKDIRYAWDFNGDGETDSTRPDPAPYIYRRAGQYEVVLKVTTLAGDSAEHRTVIRVGDASKGTGLTAAFIARPTAGSAPLVVTFSNRSFGGDITRYAWDFNGDGLIDSTQASPPPYVYQTPGIFTASLVVTGPSGTSAPQTQQITVGTPGKPLAAFVANPFFGTAPLTVTFTSYSAGVITGYAWDFNGDGLIDSTQASPPPYTYTTPGEYTVTLVVTGPGGASEPSVEVIIVEEIERLEEPTAQFSVTPATGTAPLVVTFTNQSTGNIAGYAWDFNGDGLTDSTAANPPAYTYTAPGTYAVTLVVTGLSGSRAQAAQTVTVTAPPPVQPVAAFLVTPNSGTAPLVVTFTNQSTGDIAGYAWDFNGDGLTDSTDANPPAYTYTAPGTYTVTLVVTGLSGSSVQASQTVTVTAPPPVQPVAAFSVTPNSGTAPLVVTFTNQSTGDIAGYAWDFNGDGLTDSTDTNPPAYTYTAPGTYTVTLVVTGLSGTSVQAAQTVTVTAPPPVQPVAAFLVTPNSGTAPLVVMFTNQSTGDIAGYAWDFNGDSITDSADANPPAYTYTAPGTYTVTLVVTGLSGSSAQAAQTVTVTAPSPPVEPVPESTAATVVE